MSLHYDDSMSNSAHELIGEVMRKFEVSRTVKFENTRRVRNALLSGELVVPLEGHPLCHQVYVNGIVQADEYLRGRMAVDWLEQALPERHLKK